MNTFPEESIAVLSSLVVVVVGAAVRIFRLQIDETERINSNFSNILLNEINDVNKHTHIPPMFSHWLIAKHSFSVDVISLFQKENHIHRIKNECCRSICRRFEGLILWIKGCFDEMIFADNRGEQFHDSRFRVLFSTSLSLNCSTCFIQLEIKLKTTAKKSSSMINKFERREQSP